MPITAAQFTALLTRLAKAWEDGDTNAAADCFTDDALFVDLPEERVYFGRAEIVAFFSGAAQQEKQDGFFKRTVDPATVDRPRQFSWVNIAFNEAEQTGFVEGTLELAKRYNGVVVCEIVGERIHHWRSYQFPSNLDWWEFTMSNAWDV